EAAAGDHHRARRNGRRGVLHPTVASRSVRGDDRPHPALAEFLRDIGVELAGVSGPCEVADAFAEKWGSSTTAAMRMRCYRLAELIPPDVPGSMRLAQAEDIPLLEAWEAAFSMMHRCRSGGRTTVVRSFNRWHWETRTGC